jgi:hypothetical protein
LLSNAAEQSVLNPIVQAVTVPVPIVPAMVINQFEPIGIALTVPDGPLPHDGAVICQGPDEMAVAQLTAGSHTINAKVANICFIS